MSWRFYLQALPSRQWIDKDVPLSGAVVVEAVNGPASISGTVPFEYGQLRLSGGRLAVREWGCLLIAEQDGRDPIVAIVDTVVLEGEDLRLEAGGFSMYPNEMPWRGDDYAGINVDPLDIVRMVWDHVQSFPAGDLGVVVDSTHSRVRVGKPERDVSFTTSSGEQVDFQAGPYKLNWWDTDDLGKVVADLAEGTPFEYWEESKWSGEETLSHRLRLGYPRLGARKEDLRFEVGVNITVNPTIDEGEYASDLILRGAGEGRKKLGVLVSQDLGRLRRVKLVVDESLGSKAKVTAAARPMLNRLRGEPEIESLTVVDHPSAPLGSFGAGDEIRVQGDTGWVDLDLWVRVLEVSVECDSGAMSLKVVAL